MKYTFALHKLLLAIGIVATFTAANAGSATPTSLEEVNAFRRALGSLKIPDSLTESEEAAFLSSRDSIARNILLLTYQNLTVDRIRKILRWSGEKDPEFAPGIIPASGYGQSPPYIFNRTQNWTLKPDGTVTVEVVWTPFFNDIKNHFIETQWYRKDGDMWYLFKQERRNIPGCNKRPGCIGDAT
jgi:hypothetical protein